MPPGFACLVLVKPWANGRNIVVWPSTPNIVGCYMLRPFATLLYVVGSCCVRLDTTANTNATTPNIVGPTILRVVASVWTPLPTRTLQLPTSLARQSWEILRLVARSLRRFPRPSHSCISVTHPLRPRDPKCTKPQENASPVLFFCNMHRRRVLFLKKKKKTLTQGSYSFGLFKFHDFPWPFQVFHEIRFSCHFQKLSQFS